MKIITLRKRLNPGFKSLSFLTRMSILIAVSVFVVGAGVQVLLSEKSMQGPGLTTQTYPAGTFLSHINRGGRMVSFHRGYAYFNAFTATSVWDISEPASPVKLDEKPVGSNGHRWYKMQDMFWREYSVPEVTGSGYRFLDLSNMLNRVPWTKPAPLPIEEANPNFQDLETFPITILGNNIYDNRKRELIAIGDFSQGGVNPTLRYRIGNLLFFFGGGLAVYDIGDPAKPKFLSSIVGKYEQYTTTYQIWKNYAIFLVGNDDNVGGNNLAAIDFSDPTNVKHGFGVKFADSPGRYMYFQDEYGFTGRQKHGVKLNLETKQVELRFHVPDHPLSFSDFQWIPLGHILMASGAESGSGQTFFYTHQDELDKRPPTVAYHNPAKNAVNQPLTTVIGFVINETLDDITINDENIQVRPVNGDPIEGDVISTSYQIVNFAPKQSLLPNTTYEVKFVEGGVKDAAGNGFKEFIYYFSTGAENSNANNNPPDVAGISYGSTGPILLNSVQTLTASATDPDGDNLEYRWDFNDGVGKTTWSSTSTINHTFSTAGNQVVLVQVRDGKGEIIAKSRFIIVVEELFGASPTQSSPIAVDILLRKVWVCNPDNGTVSILDADTHIKLNEIQVGDGPTSVSVDGKGAVWIACRDAGEVHVLNASTGVQITTINTGRGSAPFGIVTDPAGIYAYVSEAGTGSISKISVTTRTVVQELELGPNPRAMAITGDGNTLLVSKFISGQSEGTIWKVNLATFNVSSISLAIDSLSEDSGAAGRGVPNYIAGVAVSPTNKHAWSVGKKDNVLRGLVRDGNALTFETSVRNAISLIDINTGIELIKQRVDIDDHAQPSHVQYSPLGSHLFIAMQGNNRVIVLNPGTGKEITRVQVGKAPQGIAIDPTTNKIFVKNFLSRDVTVLDASEILNSGGFNIPVLATVSTVTSDRLTAQLLLGKQIFYNSNDDRMAQDDYISCASCHNDGGEDGRIWDFTDRGEGLRNTIGLKGRGGTAHGRVHWTANFDEIHDFENDIRGSFGGLGFMSDADFNAGTTSNPLGDPKSGKSVDLDALNAYVSSLVEFAESPHRNENGSLTSDGIAGKVLFKQLNCNSCHGGTGFTDSPSGLLHDVGTIKSTSGKRINKQLLGIDAPTLRDVWTSGPYLHDGSAATLRDVLTTQNPDGAHGNLVGLTNIQIDQLIAYINQLDGSEPADTSSAIKLAISSPEKNIQITSSSPIPLEINTNIQDITKVVYYVDGEEIVQASSAPFSAQWKPIKWGERKLQSKVFYAGGNTATLSPEIAINFKRQLNALLIVGNTNLSSGDLAVKNHLESRGFKITISDDDLVVPASAAGMDIMFMSSTIIPSSMGEDLTRAAVPAVIWDPFELSYMKMTMSTFGTDFGYTNDPVKQISITNANHPMAAGRSGNVSIYTVTQSMPFGKPTAGAVIIAEADSLPVIFGYEQGATLNGGVIATHRRVSFPLRDDFIHLFNPDGWALFDAAVQWALYGGDEVTPIYGLPSIEIQSPKTGSTVPLTFTFEVFVDNWDVKPGGKKWKYWVDGSDRGASNVLDPITISNLPAGLHTIKAQLLNADYSVVNATDEVSFTVADVPPVPDTSVKIISPLNFARVQPSFDIVFKVTEWNIATGGNHLHYFIDGVDQGGHYSTQPLPISNLSLGAHTIKLQLAKGDGSLINEADEISIVVDTASGVGPVSGKVYLEYKCSEAALSNQAIKGDYNIVNDSSGSYAMSDFKIRYWFENEGIETHQFFCDYAVLDKANVTGIVRKTTETIPGASHYIEIGFGAGTPALQANSSTGVIQTRMTKTDWTNFNQSNDYSFNSSFSSLSKWANVALYHQGTLIWGAEPGGGSSGSVISFTATPTSGVVPLNVQFNASETTGIEPLSYSWDFGDGTGSTGVLAEHLFSSIGTFAVKLTVTDGNNNVKSKSTNVIVSANAGPTASFTATPQAGIAPLTVSFDASASTDPDSDVLDYRWNFGDGSPILSGQTVTYLYSQAGNYSAKLTVNDGKGGTDLTTKSIVVSLANTVPVAIISATPLSGGTPLSVSFDGSGSTDDNGDVLTFAWDFGDGGSSTLSNPTHTYTTAGTYIATLTVDDGSGGSDQATQIIVPGGSSGGGDCNFIAPLSTALPTISNKSYSNVHVIGNGPDLSNVTNLTISWSLPDNGLWQMSLNTNNGIPDWWVDLKSGLTHTFDLAQPDALFVGSGLSGLDGSYYATMDGDNFVLIEKTNNYAIYFSNSVTPPCTSLKHAIGSDLKVFNKASLYPIPFRNMLHIYLDNYYSGQVDLDIYSIEGKLVQSERRLLNDENFIKIETSDIKEGSYVIRIKLKVRYIIQHIIKE